MTLQEKDLQKYIKQLNEKIARIGRKYGSDSLIYEKTVNAVTKYLGKDIIDTFGKITGSGFFAIDQKVATIRSLLYYGEDTIFRTINEKEDIIPSLARYNPNIRSNIKEEKEISSGFNEVFDDWYEKKYGRTQEQERERIYSNIKEAVKDWLKANAHDHSEQMKQRGWHAYMTYYEMYEIICDICDLDPTDLEENPRKIASGYVPKSKSAKSALQSWADELSKKGGLDPYASYKPENYTPGN